MSAASLSLLAQCMLGFAAMGCLCLSMERHARQIGAYLNKTMRRIALRWAGWLLIAMTLLTAIGTGGWGHGLVSVLGALSLSAVLVTGVLTYCPKWLIHTTLSGLLGGLSILGSIL